MDGDQFSKAVDVIKKARRTVAFTGAGISVESGIPPFRGPGGLWEKYDPSLLDISRFYAHPVQSWELIREIFYEKIGQATPNAAHTSLAKMEEMGKLSAVITMNIDNLHRKAGSRNVIEYHGNSQRLTCRRCRSIYKVSPEIFASMPPRCRSCQEVLKPDFVFFGEMIPFQAMEKSNAETYKADVWLVIGTTGEVYPAASLPIEAKKCGKKIIEINLNPSAYTAEITDFYLEGKASEVTSALLEALSLADT